MKKVLRDTPLMEITLRRYERPDKSNPRELVKKFCLSIGLLQPGDSRDVIVDIFQILLETKTLMNCEEIRGEIIKRRNETNAPLNGVAASNVRRQIRRLREMYFVEKVNNSYRINENENLTSLFEQKIEKFYLNEINTRVKEYFRVLKK